MSFWLVPPLVLLPRAIKGIPNATPVTWIKLALAHFGLFVGSNVVAAGIYRGVDHFCNGDQSATIEDSEKEKAEENASNNEENSAITDGDEHGAKSKVALTERQSFAYDLGKKDSLGTLIGDSKIDAEIAELTEEYKENDKATKQRKQMKLIRFWGIVSIVFYAGAGSGVINSTNPALATTSITAYAAGMSMPSKVKKVLHPLLFTALVSAVAVVIVEKIKRKGRPLETSDWTELLQEFTPAGKLSPQSSADPFIPPGKLFSLLLGPACTALAFRIFAQQKSLGKSLPAVLASSIITTIASLFISPAVGNAVGLPSELNGVLAHRSVTSALAIPSAEQCGASPELTVAAVLITGLYGASGSWLLDALKIGRPGGRSGSDENDPSYISFGRGTVVGTASHSIGTAALLAANETKASGIASVSMLVAGIAHAVVCAIPNAPNAIRTLAGQS